MTIALWCVFAASVLPYVLAFLSKTGRPYDNALPRQAIEGGWQQRANWAQQNAWEAFAPFAAAVLIAHWLHASQAAVNGVALAFIAFRIGHAAAYIGNRPTLRSLLFLGGWFCVIALYVLAARAGA